MTPRFLAVFLLGSMPVFVAGQPKFADPAPPAVHEVAFSAPKATVQEGLRFQAAPKPLHADAAPADWPWLLGPTHNGMSGEKHLLANLPPKGPAVVWEIPRGEGYAAPSIWAGRLVQFHRVDDDEVVECVDAVTGRQFWRTKYPVDYNDRYGYSNGPRCAPVIEGGRVYTMGVGGTFQSLDLASGQVIWRREIVKEFKLAQNFFGVGSAPLVEGEVLVVNIGAEGGPCVAGFDKKTGKMLWGAGSKYGPSYASPIPADIQGRRRVLVFAGGESFPPTGGLICLDPANGKIDFEFDWRSRLRESVNASSPVVVGNRVFISECYGQGSALIEVQPDMSPKLIWSDEDFGTHFMTASWHEGNFYGVHGHGPLDCPMVCLDGQNGKELWRHEPRIIESITRDAGGPAVEVSFELNRAQMIQVDGRALCLTENGHLIWLELNPQGYKELSRAWLFAGEEAWTGPVLSHGLLYICQNRRDAINKTSPRLICYDLRE